MGQESAAVLEAEIERLQKEGYKLIDRAPNVVRLMKPKGSVNVWIFLLLLFLTGPFCLLYVAYHYLNTTNWAVFDIDEEGNFKRR